MGIRDVELFDARRALGHRLKNAARSSSLLEHSLQYNTLSYSFVIFPPQLANTKVSKFGDVVWRFSKAAMKTEEGKLHCPVHHWKENKKERMRLSRALMEAKYIPRKLSSFRLGAVQYRVVILSVHHNGSLRNQYTTNQ